MSFMTQSFPGNTLRAVALLLLHVSSTSFETGFTTGSTPPASTDALREWLAGVQLVLPSLWFNQTVPLLGTLDLELSGLTCKGVSVGSVTATRPSTPTPLPLSERALKLDVEGLGIGPCAGVYRVHSKTLNLHGDVTAVVGGTTGMTATVVMVQAPPFPVGGAGPPVVRLSACRAVLDVTNLHFGGSISGDLANLLAPFIKSTLQKKSNAMACGLAQSIAALVNSSIVPFLHPVISPPSTPPPHPAGERAVINWRRVPLVSSAGERGPRFAQAFNAAVNKATNGTGIVAWPPITRGGAAPSPGQGPTRNHSGPAAPFSVTFAGVTVNITLNQLWLHGLNSINTLLLSAPSDPLVDPFGITTLTALGAAKTAVCKLRLSLLHLPRPNPARCFNVRPPHITMPRTTEHVIPFLRWKRRLFVPYCPPWFSFACSLFPIHFAHAPLVFRAAPSPLAPLPGVNVSVSVAPAAHTPPSSSSPGLYGTTLYETLAINLTMLKPSMKLAVAMAVVVESDDEDSGTKLSSAGGGGRSPSFETYHNPAAFLAATLENIDLVNITDLEVNGTSSTFTLSASSSSSVVSGDMTSDEPSLAESLADMLNAILAVAQESGFSAVVVR